MSAALGLVLLFGVLAFGSTERWALSILQAAIIALAVARPPRVSLALPALPLLAMAAVAAAQLASGFTEYRFATANELVEWSTWLVLFFVARDALDDGAVRRRFLRGMLIAGAAIAVLATVQDYTSPGAIYWLFPTRSGRSLGPFVNPDHYAAFAEALLPIAIFEAVRDRRRAVLWASLGAALYASVIVGGSRAGALIATAEILILPPLVARRWMAGALLASLAAVATLVAGWELVYRRFQESDPLRYRREMAQASVEMIRDRPWRGFGMGTFETVHPAYAGFDIGQRIDHAHNDWLEWTAEGGVPLLATWLALIVWSVRAAWRAPWAWGIHAVFAHGLVDFPMQIPAIAAVVITLLAALYASATTGLRSSPSPST
ncbi:MAG: O-antigen ligase family protein [Bryobacteraceae bacterium]